MVNPENGHAHLLYAIETPVFCTPDHQRPLRLAAAIQEAYRAKLDADPGYSGLITKNPLHPHWRVLAHSGAVYDLPYLSGMGRPVPSHKTPSGSPSDRPGAQL